MKQLNDQSVGNAVELIVAEIQALRADFTEAKREIRADFVEINAIFDRIDSHLLDTSGSLAKAAACLPEQIRC